MNINPKDSLALAGLKYLATQGVGFVFLALLGYAIYVQVPNLAEQHAVFIDRQGKFFAQQLSEISKANEHAAEMRTEAIARVLDEYRQDEKHDLQLLVSVLKRADLTPRELSEAIQEAADSAK